MRLILAATSLLAFAAASPCKPKSKSTTDSASVTSTSVQSTTASPTSTPSSTASLSSETSLSGTPTATSTVSSTGFSVSSDSSSSSASSSIASEPGSTSTSTSLLTTTSSASELITTTSSDASTTISSTSSSSSTDVFTTTAASSDVSSTVSSTSSGSTETSATGPSPTPTTTSSTSVTSVPPTTTTSATSSTSSVNNPATASVTDPVARSFYDANLKDGNSGRANPEADYICYAGPAINFPAQSTWASFEAMWALLSQRALAAIGDTPAQVNDIHDAIVNVSSVAGVDARVILAVVVTESTGNVNVGCTFNGVENCGLMQSYEGVSYNPNDSRNSIRQMIQDGTQGTTTGPGLVQLLNDQTRSQGNLWQALRLYNSGSLDPTNLSDGRGAVDAYVSFVANYLTGWVGFGQDVNDCDYSQPFDTTPPN